MAHNGTRNSNLAAYCMFHENLRIILAHYNLLATNQGSVLGNKTYLIYILATQGCCPKLGSKSLSDQWGLFPCNLF